MKSKFISLLVLLFFPFCVIDANIIRVNNAPGKAADFKTLQEAIDNANSGDTLYLEGTQFNYGTGGVVVDKKLIIFGPGYFLEENDTTQATPLKAFIKGALEFNSQSEGSEIYGLYLLKLKINVNNIKVERNFIKNRVDFNDVSQCVFQKNFVQDYLALNKSLNMVIKNNIVMRIEGDNDCSAVIYNNTVENEISVYNSDIKNNIIYRSCVGCGQGVDKNTGNVIKYNLVCRDDKPEDPTNKMVDKDALFVDGFIRLNFGESNEIYSTDGKFRLAVDSPALESGEAGTDCGAFGGENPYVLSGLPAVPRIYDVNIPSSASTESGLPVTIKVKTNK